MPEGGSAGAQTSFLGKRSQNSPRELLGGQGGEFDMSPDTQNLPSSSLPSLHNLASL